MVLILSLRISFVILLNGGTYVSIARLFYVPARSCTHDHNKIKRPLMQYMKISVRDHYGPSIIHRDYLITMDFPQTSDMTSVVRMIMRTYAI